MNLLSTIVSISLFALTVGAGITYINPNAGASAQTKAIVSSGLQTLAQAYQTRQITGAPPPNAETWKDALFPAFGFEPKPPDGTAWSYGTVTSGRWFCLSAPNASDSLRIALAAVAKTYSASSFVVSDACGADPVTVPAQPSATKAAAAGNSVAATLWISRGGA